MIALHLQYAYIFAREEEDKQQPYQLPTQSQRARRAAVGQFYVTPLNLARRLLYIPHFSLNSYAQNFLRPTRFPRLTSIFYMI